METKSEELFQAYCQMRGYEATRIVQKGLGRISDFKVCPPFGAVICEIKELQANDEDVRFFRAMNAGGWASQRRRPGKRIAQKIKDGADQLGRYRDDPAPTVLVLYENIMVDGIKCFGNYLGSLDIDAGMFGKALIIFNENKTPEAPNTGFGGNRLITEDRRRYISALAVLSDPKDRGLCLDIYHNPFAIKPLYPQYFSHGSDEHWLKDGHPDDVGHGWMHYIGKKE